ncbi:gliding motility-associated-like protein [Winogradskyella pacifica]|uniref:Gliding motility-associated-like protein n=1 Tax=Winogradskyella pacifica TaxID=664642 RepID=A0A3D9LKE4_9FLAO|nr:T9SS type B sorting domain-containing protein [Winogradskyella pacifica]REE07859.1 gliding motility-associated-like protein [Winogradskyella pacifica]
MKKDFSLLTLYFILSGFITYSQNNTDCWTLINNGVDIYNGQYNDNDYPGYHDPETTDLEEVTGGFLTTGQYNKQTFDSNDNNIYTNLEDKDGSYLTKHDYDGNLQWIVYTEKNINSYRDVMFGSVEDNEGNIYVIGHSINGTFFDSNGTPTTFVTNDNWSYGFIVKLNSDGELLWHITIDNVFSKKINIDEDGNILLSGDISIYNNFNFNLYLNGVITDNLSNFEIMGNNSNYVNRSILKINPEGELLWYTSIKTSGPNGEFLIDIGSDNNNNIYVTGYCSSQVDIYSAGLTENPNIITWSGYSSKTFVIKFDENGQVLWNVKSYIDSSPASDGVLAYSMFVDGQGNSYISGSNDSRSINSADQVFENNDGSITSEHVGTFFIAKVNTNGICEWIKGAADSYAGTGFKVIKSNDEIIVVGNVQAFQFLPEEVEFLSSDGNNIEALFYSSDYFLAIYDTDGNIKRILTNGINENVFFGGRISGFFKDSNDNYYLSRNLYFFEENPQDYINFGHIIRTNSGNGSDGTISKFKEDCGVVIGDIINQDMPNLSLCDNTSVGTDTDGLVNFDLTQNEDEILINEPLSNYQISYYKDSGLTDLILNPEVYENTFQSETIFIKAEHSFDSDKYGETSFEIEVYALPITNTPVTLSQCDDDLDGFSVFNLIIVNAELSTNDLNETITFHETEVEADNGANPIPNTTAYPNQTVSTDMVWARIENANECHRTAEVNLVVSTTQIPNSFTKDFYQCDDGLGLADGIATFNFSTVTSDIQNLYPTGQQLIINYYRNQADALAETNPIVDISNYQNIGYPNQQNIFIRVESATNNECLGLGHHITLHVEPAPLVTEVINVEQCDENNDGTEAFSTSSFEQILSEGQTIDVSFLYNDEDGNALPSPLPDPYIASQPITNITVTIVSEEENDLAVLCEVTTNITLVINSGFDTGEIPEYFACADSLDSQSYTFDTSNLESSIVNGQSDVLVSFFDEGDNLIESPFPDEYTLTESTIIKAAISNVLDPMCTTELDINFIITEKPLFLQIEDVYLCFEEDEAQVFDLRNYLNNNLSDSMLENTQIIAFDGDLLLDDIINIDFESDMINYRIENINYPDCYSIGEFNIYASVVPAIGNITDMVICDDESNDGFEAFSLETKDDEVLNGLPSDTYVASYHLSYNDAVENSNALSSPYINIVNSQTIYARLSFQNYLNCYDIGAFDLVVKSVPDFTGIENEYYLCKGDEDLVISAGDGLDYYFWSTGARTTSVTISEPGQYTITAIRDYANLSCEISKTFIVYESSLAYQIEVIVSDGSLTANTIEIIAEGIGDYEYSIDGINYQDSNMFYDLTERDYVIYIRDKNGCGVATHELFLLRYPKFFTPNQDAKNDFWQLYNSYQEPGNIVSIFNRYGKLLLRLDPMTRGWDGTFNGVKMPSDDYWFVLKRQNGETFSGHFSLVR